MLDSAIREIYENTIKPLAPADRFRLATLILNEIPPQAVANYSDDWSDEDLRDISLDSLRSAAASFGEDVDEP
jgi:hypothetical protein